MTWMQESGVFAVRMLALARGLTPLPAQYLLAGVWQGAILAAVASLCVHAGPKMRAQARFVVWAIVFALVALLPCFAIYLAFSPSAGKAVAGHTFLRLAPGWAMALDVVWGMAALWSLLRFSIDLARLWRLARNARAVDAASLPAEIQKSLNAGGPVLGRRAVSLRLSGSVDAPCAVGFFRPVILVPEWLWEKLTPVELKQIVLHEMAHLRRGDDWSNLLQKLLRALCPLNPILFWVERNLCLEREMACDDAVLEAAEDARDYATCLTSLAEAKMLRRQVSLAPSAWQRRSELTRRVHGILNRKRKLSPVFSVGTVCASLVFIFVAAAVLAHSPELVSFAAPAPAPAMLAAAAPGASSPSAALPYPQFHYQAASLRLPARGGASPLRPARTNLLCRQGTPLPLRAVRNGRSGMRELRLSSSAPDRQETWIVFTLWQTSLQIPAAGGSPSETLLPFQSQWLNLSTPNRWIILQI